MRKIGITLLGAALVACGGGGGGGGGGSSTTSTATGYFKDSNTQGLSYVSGGQTGVTGADGSFTYEVGQPVTFKLGTVTLGTVSTGKSIVSPVDLVTSGSTTTPAVQNMVRFLMMLDTDGDPTNGIQISAAVRTAAASFAALNFAQTEAAFTTAVSSHKAAAIAADSGSHTLPTAAAAQTHVEGTLRCARAGGYKGTFTGSDTGTWGLLVSANSGMATGFAYSTVYQNTMTVTGTTAMTLDQSAAFTSGVAGGATYSGNISGNDSVSGTWSGTGVSGTFAGSRVGGSLNSKYRFTGQFSGSPTAYGLLTFDVDGSNAVSGTAYNVWSNTAVAMTGTVSGSSLSGAASNGVTFSATINLAAGTLASGTWTGSGSSGTFTGDGCTLN